ncbi:hypothetical protein [Fretibacterium sp. OH1220_COT-178]|nr:hypothetical protein [Fretibacterium sp. OH1220_COT-178]
MKFFVVLARERAGGEAAAFPATVRGTPLCWAFHKQKARKGEVLPCSLTF